MKLRPGKLNITSEGQCHHIPCRLRPVLAYKTSRDGTQLGQIEARPFVWVTVTTLICMQAYRSLGSTGLTLSHTLIYVLISPYVLFSSFLPLSFLPPLPFLSPHYSLLKHLAFLMFLFFTTLFCFTNSKISFQSSTFYSYLFFLSPSFLFFFLQIFNSLFSLPQSLHPPSSFFHINSQSDK